MGITRFNAWLLVPECYFVLIDEEIEDRARVQRSIRPNKGHRARSSSQQLYIVCVSALQWLTEVTPGQRPARSRFTALLVFTQIFVPSRPRCS
jgi:hypothetical protein